MKKIVSVILALLLLCGVAYAITIDLSEYSDDELIELETAIQAEKLERGMAKSATIYAGKYTVGVDIPAGVYSVNTLNGAAADHIYVYDSNGRTVASYAIGTSSKRPPVGKMELLDGYTVEWEECVVEFVIYTGGITFE